MKKRIVDIHKKYEHEFRIHFYNGNWESFTINKFHVVKDELLAVYVPWQESCLYYPLKNIQKFGWV